MLSSCGFHLYRTSATQRHCGSPTATSLPFAIPTANLIGRFHVGRSCFQTKRPQHALPRGRKGETSLGATDGPLNLSCTHDPVLVRFLVAVGFWGVTGKMQFSLQAVENRATLRVAKQCIAHEGCERGTRCCEHTTVSCRHPEQTHKGQAAAQLYFSSTTMMWYACSHNILPHDTRNIEFEHHLTISHRRCSASSPHPFKKEDVGDASYKYESMLRTRRYYCTYVCCDGQLGLWYDVFSEDTGSTAQ